MSVNILLIIFFSMLTGFLAGALCFLESGKVTTTDDWREQMRDQRQRRSEPR